VFFSGGAQSRLTEVLLNTRLLGVIKNIYNSGGVIAGTSAGAAVMSQIMITGDEKKYGEDDRAFATIEKNNIVTTKGFGFIGTAVIDQHFIARKRHNRLISIVLENPHLIGIGIDESTAIIIDPNLNLSVIGDGQIIIYDAKGVKDISVDNNDLFSATGIVMHILRSGKSYSLERRVLIN
jgi:cyanophycinase